MAAKKSSVSIAANSSSMTPATSVMTKPPVLNSNVEETKASNFSVASTFDFSQAVAKDERSEIERDSTLFLAPSYRINDRLSVGGRIIVSKAHYGPQNTTLANTAVTLSILGSKLSETLESFYTVGTVLPTDEVVRKEDRFQTSISAGAGLKYVNPYFKLTPRVGLGRNFHEYDRNFEGRANLQYRLTTSIDLSIPFTDKLSLEQSFAYRMGRTYQNSERYDYDSSTSLAYSATEKLSVYLGTANNRVAALKSNGVDSNISAFDEKTSVFSGGLTYVY